MPLYDFRCSACGTIREILLPLRLFSERLNYSCRLCERTTEQELQVRPTAVQDWGNGGSGRWFEHLGPHGMTFYDRASYRAHLKKEGLQEWAPRRGMPGQEV